MPYAKLSSETDAARNVIFREYRKAVISCSAALETHFLKKYNIRLSDSSNEILIAESRKKVVVQSGLKLYSELAAVLFHIDTLYFDGCTTTSRRQLYKLLRKHPFSTPKFYEVRLVAGEMKSLDKAYSKILEQLRKKMKEFSRSLETLFVAAPKGSVNPAHVHKAKMAKLKEDRKKGGS